MRVDIVIDLETLGTQLNTPILQLAAVAFNIETGEILDKLNVELQTDYNYIFDHVSADTLKWWLKTNPEYFKQLLTHDKEENEGQHRSSELDMLESFSSFIGINSLRYKTLSETGCNVYPDIYLWGNGILFDNAILKYKYDEHAIKYPIKYTNDRDVRTIVELACKIKQIDEHTFREYYSLNLEAHNALNDCLQEAKWISEAYKIILDKTRFINEIKEN